MNKDKYKEDTVFLLDRLEASMHTANMLRDSIKKMISSGYIPIRYIEDLMIMNEANIETYVNSLATLKRKINETA